MPKVIQIAMAHSRTAGEQYGIMTLVILCDNGDIWEQCGNHWERVPLPWETCGTEADRT